MIKYLEPISRSGYLRVGLLIISFYCAVQMLTSHSKLGDAMLIEDLRNTAMDLADIKKAARHAPPTSLDELSQRGLMSKELLERCKEANVVYHPENSNNVDGLAVFSVPTKGGAPKRVTPNGLVLR